MRIAELERLDYPQDIIDAVAGHAEFLEVPRETQMAKTLFAVDELSGFIAACALVRPTGIEGMKPKSVKKKLKQPSFAAAVDRGQVQRGIEELGVDPDEHMALIIEALAAQCRRARHRVRARAPQTREGLGQGRLGVLAGLDRPAGPERDRRLERDTRTPSATSRARS